MRRCTNCILPETTPSIAFDEDGVCNFCGSHKHIAPLGGDALRALFDKYPGQKYDCILGLSGGRDSSYALYLLTQVYHKKVLAIHYRMPLSHEQATINARRIADAFGTKLQIIEDKNDLHRKCFTNNIKAYAKKPSLAMTSMMCVACKVKWIEIFDIAKNNGVKLIIAASNPYEDSSFKKIAHGIHLHNRYIFAHRFAAGVREILKNPSYINRDTFITTLRAFMYLDTKSPFLRLIYPGIKKIDLFYYLHWDEKTVLATILKYGWDKPKDEKSSWRFDCLVGKVKDYIYASNYGFTEKDDLYSKMIREGMMTRMEALARIEDENLPNTDAVEECLCRCGLCLKDLPKLNARV